MSSQPTTFKILLTGLRTNAPIPDYFRTLYGQPSEISAKIAADAQRLKEAGHDVCEYFLDENDLATGLEWLTTKLRDKRFDGIMIGSGLRLIPEMTSIFEKVVNVVVNEGRGSVLMFNDGPGGNWDAVQRSREKLEEVRTGKA
ncbi:hypothetical protein DE146DRAFT_370303 [Phaeosphaeria sp. MPI-PUGE-AT-0046c]|nr:hypothetical protein DE146DRAFT_370303 [Phaeosphaeria sp. MPI-PUGE-AT-0046c]